MVPLAALKIMIIQDHFNSVSCYFRMQWWRRGMKEKFTVVGTASAAPRLGHTPELLPLCYQSLRTPNPRPSPPGTLAGFNLTNEIVPQELIYFRSFNCTNTCIFFSGQSSMFLSSFQNLQFLHSWLMLLWVNPILSSCSPLLANRPQISSNRNSTTKRNKGFNSPSKSDHKAVTNPIFPPQCLLIILELLYPQTQQRISS